MTQDWLLTLLAMLSPYLLVAAIVILVLALSPRPTQGDRVRRSAETNPLQRGSDQIEKANPIPHHADARCRRTPVRRRRHVASSA